MEEAPDPISPYGLLFKSASLIPISHYILAFVCISIAFLYNYLEFHLLQDLFRGFRGSHVLLTFNSHSQIYEGVASKCRILHGRYLATPWLSNPHFQTVFLNFFGNPPSFTYTRQIFHTPDDGTIALDWLLSDDVVRGQFHMNNVIPKDDTTPIMVVVPGLTSDSTSAYIKHLAFSTAKRGWNVVVGNHRGLGGISITSDCFYNAGWTEDVRVVIDHLHNEYPQAPLFAVGTSIGANILVKYLGEDGENIPVAGAAAICSPWDLLIGDRFISRRLLQKFYDRALTIGLQGYALLHQPRYSRLADWEGIRKSSSIRDFDNFATCLVGKFETVDTYYRRCSSASYVGNVSVPLLCINALDDPVCTREAIPWDECRANKNIVLATPEHGGHLAFFEGITGSSLWWVRAVNEFLGVLHSSPYMHTQNKIQTSGLPTTLQSSIDQGPYVNVTEDGMVAEIGIEKPITEDFGDSSETHETYPHDKTDQMASNTAQADLVTETESDLILKNPETANETTSLHHVGSSDTTSHIKKRINQLSRQHKVSMWLLGYIAVVTTWPLLGPTFHFLFKEKLRNYVSKAMLGR